MSSERIVQPHQLVTSGHRWYFLAWDQSRDDWRTFRLDGLRAPGLTGRRFMPRKIPGRHATNFVARSLGSTPPLHEGTLAIRAPAAELTQHLGGIEQLTA